MRSSGRAGWEALLGSERQRPAAGWQAVFYSRQPKRFSSVCSEGPKGRNRERTMPFIPRRRKEKNDVLSAPNVPAHWAQPQTAGWPSARAFPASATEECRRGSRDHSLFLVLTAWGSTPPPSPPPPPPSPRRARRPRRHRGAVAAVVRSARARPLERMRGHSTAGVPLSGRVIIIIIIVIIIIILIVRRRPPRSQGDRRLPDVFSSLSGAAHVPRRHRPAGPVALPSAPGPRHSVSRT